ncbi:MAG: alpha/beta hydrolase [Thermoguttaceae bacterium]|nr:alpha/beta hydrolase [Thermoguttaceae bacterium]
MKKVFTFSVLTAFSLFLMTSLAPALFAGERVNLWPDGKTPNFEAHQTVPTYEICVPENKTSDSCVIVFPGGAYQGCCDQHEGVQIANFFNEKGITAVIVRYRVSRPKLVSKHVTAWQDAQRAVRTIRSKAAELGINPEKIGCTGFSAGGHLTLMTSTSSQTPAYPAIDELDNVPCHVNFAIPVYPAYVLEDGNNGPNKGKGNDSKMVADFAFDAKTPPMCFIHGDLDVYSPMGSVAVYHKLRTMNIPAEIHIYANVNHGFGGVRGDEHVKAWLDRVLAWMKVMGF